METNTSFTEGKILKPLILFAFAVIIASYTIIRLRPKDILTKME